MFQFKVGDRVCLYGDSFGIVTEIDKHGDIQVLFDGASGAVYNYDVPWKWEHERVYKSPLYLALS